MILCNWLLTFIGNMSSCLFKSPCLLNLRNPSAKYVDNKILRQFQSFPVCLGKTSAKKNIKDSAESFVYDASNGFGIRQHFAKGSDLVFLAVEIISSTYFIFFTYNISLADSLVLISLCILVIVGEHIIQR